MVFTVTVTVTVVDYSDKLIMWKKWRTIEKKKRKEMLRKKIKGWRKKFKRNLNHIKNLFINILVNLVRKSLEVKKEIRY